MIFGRNPTNTLVIEREWESMAAMETVMMKAMADPEYHALGVAFEPWTVRDSVAFGHCPGEDQQRISAPK